MNTIFIFIVGVGVGFGLARVFGKGSGAGAPTPASVAPQNRKQHAEKEARKEKILALLAERKEIRNRDVETLLGISDASATNYLDELEKEGKVAQAGATGRGVSYRLK